MMKPIQWKKLTKAEQSKILKRPHKPGEDNIYQKVKDIIDVVRAEGDAACLRLTQKWDGVDLVSLEVSKEEFEEARQALNDSTRRAISRVIKQLEAFHEPQLQKELRVETSPGVLCESLPRPIQNVGLYVPGGTAPLISTVLMLGVPAKLANCPNKIMCSPPNREGRLAPAVLVAAELCGIYKIYKLGGAQAIAAMAFGTKTIQKVDKIFGPGNAWVTQAKLQVSQESLGALSDLPAGPSEVMVIADKKGNPITIAADLLSQAEHGMDSQVMFVCTDPLLMKQVYEAIQTQLKTLPRREFVEKALEKSAFIVVDQVLEALLIANEYAPEHLILQIEQPRHYLEVIQNAGSVFLGPWSPEAAGDYASGTNHVLPTGGYAKSVSGLSVRDFMKSMTVQELSRDGLRDLADTIRELAMLEGLEAHRRAVDLRLEGGDLCKTRS